MLMCVGCMVGTLFKKFIIMKTMSFNAKKLLFSNPCAQLDTCATNIFVHSINISQNVEAKYNKECVHVFEDNDLLKMEYNPFSGSPESSENASNFNESSKVDSHETAA